MTSSISTPNRLKWIEVRNYSALLRKGKRALVVSIFQVPGDAFNAVALETTVAAARGGLDGVLDEHGHKVLGKDLSLEQAKKACREFAKKWMTKRRAKKCVCKEIEAT